MLIEKEQEKFPNPKWPKLRALQQQLFSLSQNCKSLKSLTQIHTQIVINGFSNKSFLLVKVVSLYLTWSQFQYACRSFERIENPSVTLWNQMIKGHVRSETPQKGVELFNEMVRLMEPDGYTYGYVLSGCVKGRLVREGIQIHGRVLVNGLFSNVFVGTILVQLYGVGGGASCARKVFDEMCKRTVVSWNSLLLMYLKCGDFGSGMKVFDEMPERSVVSWSILVSECARNGKCRLALRLFDEMRRARVKLDQVALIAALSACAELGDLKLGEWIHSYVDKTFSSKGHDLLVALNNALVHMYASCGAIEQAYKVFRWMPKRNMISWTTIINAFAKNGDAQKAVAAFQFMQSVGTKDERPDDLTFIGVLTACSRAGLVSEGRQCFENMVQHWGVEPQIEHHGCMVDLLSRAGLLEEAFHLVKSMPMKPSESIWGALLNGCRIHKNLDLASTVARQLVADLPPDRTAGYFSLLADVYAAAGRWQDVASIRKKMGDMGVIKPAGRSWVQVNGAVHDFLAGDSSHKHASSIYEMLEFITKESMSEGRIPNIVLQV